jgi:hypothetical protein
MLFSGRTAYAPAAICAVESGPARGRIRGPLPSSNAHHPAMGFDLNEDKPILNVHKWTTKVNIWMIAAAVLFLGLGGLLIMYLAHRQNQPPASEPPPPAISNGPATTR